MFTLAFKVIDVPMILPEIIHDDNLERGRDIANADVDAEADLDHHDPEEGDPEAALGDGSSNVTKTEDEDEQLEAGCVVDMNIRGDHASTRRSGVDEHLENLESETEDAGDDQSEDEQSHLVPSHLDHD